MESKPPMEKDPTTSYLSPEETDNYIMLKKIEMFNTRLKLENKELK